MHTQNGFFVASGECEIGNLSVSRAHSVLENAGHDGLWITSDASSGVTAEIIFPPLPVAYYDADEACFMPYMPTWNFYNDVYTTLENAGAEINVGCGHHLHIVASMGVGMIDAFYDAAIYKARYSDYNDSADEKYLDGAYYGDIMPFELVKDVVYRYGMHQNEINKMLSRSRRDNRMCNHLYNRVRHDDFDGITTMGNLNAHLGGKFCAINVSTYNTYGTIEFRQHQGTLSSIKMRNWCMLICNMIRWSDTSRLSYDAQGETEIMPFRYSSRNGVAWSMCRSDDGASVQELMDAIGWNPNNVRRTISEWRSRFGDDVVQTVSQQNNGASYGDGDTHTRYIVRRTIGNTVGLLPENRIGQSSIYAGLHDEIYEYLQERISELS
jgi:hypothetical protein